MATKKPFVLVSTEYGTMIVNRLDYRALAGGGYCGVGYGLLNNEVDIADDDILLMKHLLDFKRKVLGDGVVMLDAGANIGVYALACAQHMRSWGRVVAVEAQERIYYALAGNMTINNCFNAQAIWAALSNKVSTMKMPVPNYLEPASFGSLELEFTGHNEFIGQTIDYSEDNMVEVQTKTIDSLNLGRVDFIKMDVEGMELKALEGGRETIRAYKPFMFIEHIKVDQQAFACFLEEYDYIGKEFGMNTLAFHKDDKIADHMK